MQCPQLANGLLVAKAKCLVAKCALHHVYMAMLASQESNIDSAPPGEQECLQASCGERVGPSTFRNQESKIFRGRYVALASGQR